MIVNENNCWTQFFRWLSFIFSKIWWKMPNSSRLTIRGGAIYSCMISKVDRSLIKEEKCMQTISCLIWCLVEKSFASAVRKERSNEWLIAADWRICFEYKWAFIFFFDKKSFSKWLKVYFVCTVSDNFTGSSVHFLSESKYQCCSSDSFESAWKAADSKIVVVADLSDCYGRFASQVLGWKHCSPSYSLSSDRVDFCSSFGLP